MLSWIFKHTSEYKFLKSYCGELEKKNKIMSDELDRRGHVFFVDNIYIGITKISYGFVTKDGDEFVYRSEFK